MAKEKGFTLDWKDKLQWRWFKDPNTAHLFEYFTLAANFKDGYFENETVHRGECVGSYAKFASETGLSVQEVRTALKHLISTGEVTKRSLSKYTVVTVTNYDEYQSLTNDLTGEQQASNTPVTSNQQASNNNRNKENKEINIKEVEIKEKNIKKENFVIPPEIAEAFSEFEKMRNRIKKPMTDRAKRDALAKLERLAPHNYELQNKILDQSIFNCYVGLFPLKDENGGVGYGKSCTADKHVGSNGHPVDTMSAVVI